MGSSELIEIRVKSVLNRVTGMPFAWSVNPYRGCAHGCVFCYARRTHWFMNRDGVADWSSKIFVKINAPEAVRAELARPLWRREEVALGTATDPYQAAEKRYLVTRRILEALYDFNTPVGIITRSPLIERDIDVLRRLAERAAVRVCVSVVTMDAGLARKLEPTVAPPQRRMEIIRRLRDAGIYAGISLAPVLPFINDRLDQLAQVFHAAKAAGAQFVWHRELYLGPVTRDAFFNYLSQCSPELVEKYGKLYGATYLPQAECKRIEGVVEAARRQSGFTAAPRPKPSQYRQPSQLALAITAFGR